MSSPSLHDLWQGRAKKQPCVLWPRAVIVVPERWVSKGGGVWLKEAPCPCFCIEGTRYVTLCLLLSKSFPPFQGRYGCCRFLRDGYRTPKEVSVLSPAAWQNLTAKQQPAWMQHKGWVGKPWECKSPE